MATLMKRCPTSTQVQPIRTVPELANQLEKLTLGIVTPECATGICTNSYFTHRGHSAINGNYNRGFCYGYPFLKTESARKHSLFHSIVWDTYSIACGRLNINQFATEDQKIGNHNIQDYVYVITRAGLYYLFQKNSPDSNYYYVSSYENETDRQRQILNLWVEKVDNDLRSQNIIHWFKKYCEEVGAHKIHAIPEYY